MSKKIEKYCELLEKRKTLASRIGALRGEITQLKESLGPDPGSEILKLEILGEPKAAAAKKAALKETTAGIAGLEAELEESEKRSRIMGELLPDLRAEARAELVTVWRERFATAVSPFVQKLKETADAERRLAEFRKEANNEFHKFGLGEAPIPALPQFLLKAAAGYPQITEVEGWLRELHAQGIFVEE